MENQVRKVFLPVKVLQKQPDPFLPTPVIYKPCKRGCSVERTQNTGNPFSQSVLSSKCSVQDPRFRGEVLRVRVCSLFHPDRGREVRLLRLSSPESAKPAGSQGEEGPLCAGLSIPRLRFILFR